MAVVTYYFDGHTSITDTGASWTNDANAFDGSTSTFASSTSGGTSLVGQGTNSSLPPNVTVTQVRARTFGFIAGDPVATWGPYVVLSAPTGGWESNLPNLKLTIFTADGAVGLAACQINANIQTNASQALGSCIYDGTVNGVAKLCQSYRTELEVTYTTPAATIIGLQSITGINTITF